MKLQNSHAKAAVPGLLAVILWGIAPVVTRGLSSTLSGLDVAAWRTIIATAVLSPWVLPGFRQLHAGRDLLLTAMAGCCNVIGYNLLVAIGLQWVPASIAAMILAAEPIWVMALSVIILSARVQLSTWIGCAVALVGVALIVMAAQSDRAVDSHALFGILLVAVGTIFFAMYSVSISTISAKIGPIQATATSSAFGALPYLAVMPWCNAPWHGGSTSVLALLFLGVAVSGFGIFAWNFTIDKIASHVAALFLFLEPVVGIVGAVLFLDEALSPAKFVGILVVLTGLALASASRADIT